MVSFRRESVACALLLLLFGNVQSASARTLDPLQESSEISVRSQTMLLTSVARAGHRLVAVGERGIVLLSDDDGTSWRQVGAPVRVTLTKVFFVSASQGWATGHGGVVLASADGGETWRKVFDGVAAAATELKAAETAVSSVMENDQGAARRLRDAQRLVADGPDKPFLDVYFRDERHGMVIGAYGLAFATDDGGEHWNSLMGELANPKGLHLYGVRPAAGGLYIVGEQGLLLRRQGEGEAFAALPSPSTGTLFGIVSAGSGEIVVYGLRGHAYRSTSAGQSWEKLDFPPVTMTAAMRLADGSFVLADEAGGVVRSEDGGRSFVPLPVPRTMAVSGIVEASDGTAVLVGTRGAAKARDVFARKQQQ